MNTNFLNANHKEFSYPAALQSLKALFTYERNPIANLANFSAFVHDTFGYHWTGFYLVNKKELILGPFQGPIACTRIGYGKGVCGTAWAENSTKYVPNVHEFPGHIACSEYSNSELVIPINVDGKTIGVLDIDSDQFDDFSAERIAFLEEACSVLTEHTDWAALP